MQHQLVRPMRRARRNRLVRRGRKGFLQSIVVFPPPVLFYLYMPEYQEHFPKKDLYSVLAVAYGMYDFSV